MIGKNPRSARILPLALLAVLLFAQPVSAYTMLDSAFGTPVDAGNPRAAAMASVGVSLYQGSSTLIHNPAMLGYMEDRGLVELNLGFSTLTEDRFQPVYDSFSSYVTETTIASNKNSYGLLQGGALFRLGPDRAMALGLGIFDRYVFDYDYAEEIRDNTNFSTPSGRDEVVQLRRYELQGRLRSVSMGYGVRLLPQLSLGLGLHRYFGTLENRVDITSFPRANPGDHELLSDPGNAAFRHELAGWSWSLGVSGSVHTHLDLGVSYEGPFTVKGAFSSPDSVLGRWYPYDQSETVMEIGGGDVELKYPGTLSMGLTLRPQNVLSTVFSLELVHRWWSEVYRDSYRAATFTSAGEARNTWDVRLGLEHVFYNNMPARFGFRYLENYADRESARSIFSAGLGYEAAGFGVDLGLQYHRQTTRQDYIFDPTLVWTDGIDTPPAGLSKVEDGMFTLTVGLSRRF